MNPLLLGALIGGGAGLGKSLFFDAPREESDRKLAASTQRYSPWTGLKANPIRESDPLGSAMQFGTTGAMMAQNVETADQSNALSKSMQKYYEQGGPATFMMAPGAQGAPNAGGGRGPASVPNYWQFNRLQRPQAMNDNWG